MLVWSESYSNYYYFKNSGFSVSFQFLFSFYVVECSAKVRTCKMRMILNNSLFGIMGFVKLYHLFLFLLLDCHLSSCQSVQFFFRGDEKLWKKWKSFFVLPLTCFDIKTNTTNKLIFFLDNATTYRQFWKYYFICRIASPRTLQIYLFWKKYWCSMIKGCLKKHLTFFLSEIIMKLILLEC